MFRGNTAYLRNFIRSKSDPLVKVVKKQQLLVRNLSKSNIKQKTHQTHRTKPLQVKFLENGEISLGEAPKGYKKAPKAPEKAYNLMARHEVELRRPGRLRNKTTYLEDYLGFQKKRVECNDN